MATRIITKNGSGAPLASDLQQGELAVDLTNKRLYTENASGTVLELGTAPSTIDINAGTIDGTVIGATTPAAGSFTTISASGEIAANGGIAFGDSDKATFGASDDLQIYHDGSHSYISDQGTGNVRILAENFQVRNPENNEAMILAIPDFGVSLYYNDNAKLATTATGIDVIGTVTADGLAVDGDAVINDTIPQLQFMESDTTDVNSVLKTTAGQFRIQTINDAATSTTNRFIIDHATGDLSLYDDTGTTAKFFWDASAESLGIGTTSPESPIDINRTSTDGNIATFRKDGTAVGSIGSVSGDSFIGTGTAGLRFFDFSSSIIPHNTTTNVSSNGVVNLGVSSNRFKDLYLSGGVYLGGTGAANHLDDYEEGTWSPTMRTGTSAAWTNVFAENSYTKVGSLVTISISGTMTATGTTAISSLYLSSALPFAPRSFTPMLGYGQVIGSDGSGMKCVNTSLTYPISDDATIVPAKTVGQTVDYAVFLQYHTST